MFFTGSLQEGISKALQESKLVVCFVTDSGEESKTWEDEYLTDDTIAPSLEKDAVLLRLEAGSEEAGYLAAIFPLPKYPTLVIIKNGELKEYIAAGTSKEQFVRRVGGAFQAQAAGQGPETAAAASTPPPPPSSDTQAPSQDTPTAPPSSTSSSAGQQQPAQSSTVAALAREGEARRQAARKEREAMEKRRREKGKMKEEEQARQDPEKAKQIDAKKKAAQQLAERQRQAREERARVLKRIEDDKAERKAREEARRAEKRAAAAGDSVEELTAAAGEPAPSSTITMRQHDQCAIQVRLFDGSTIRTRLPAKATLAKDVRKWIDEARGDGNTPYTFKVIMTPLPNRTIDPATEEDKTLRELGLAPSSTLVLAPVDRFSPAYPGAGAGTSNPLSRLIAAILAFLGSILGGIAGALTGSGNRRRETRGEGGGGQTSGGELQDRVQGQATGRDAASGSRFKGFENLDDRQRDHQLYNGNSLNFEPRKDEEEKDK
ncbi:UBX domain-containing protein 4 [Cytospora mali]|uniref:UBX domain-containing protein 2 n=1 Tax=Cytospora mali TaxID=578113 RepID=A0A194VFH0_CYTMA|nr:UBX domain-containing protein 4 [Valsa mali var. pyri (nom. inval.)]